jgi:hypothetical protein
MIPNIVNVRSNSLPNLFAFFRVFLLKILQNKIVCKRAVELNGCVHCDADYHNTDTHAGSSHYVDKWLAAKVEHITMRKDDYC